MKSDFELLIVIVNFRTGPLVVDCLSSLMERDTVADDTRIVVVDAASGDGSVETIAAAIQARNWGDVIDLLPLDVNKGFAYGNNSGIAHAEVRFGAASYMLLLNPDTVVRPGAISSLVTFMNDTPAAGVAGSRLEDPDGTQQACAFRFPSAAAEFESEVRTGVFTTLLRRWQVAPVMADVPSRIDWVSGASMIVRRDVLNAIGGLDERFFLYYEEVDFCMRALRAGWECWHVPESRVVHLVGQSTGVTVQRVRPSRRPAYWFHSRRHYYLKHHGRAYCAVADICWILGHAFYRLRCAVQGKPVIQAPHLLHDFVRYAMR